MGRVVGAEVAKRFGLDVKYGCPADIKSKHTNER